MAYFTFSCPQCGEFTEWHTSLKGKKDVAHCPECETLSKRVFRPPLTYRMDSRVKQTIEQGMEPKLVKKENMVGTPIQQAVQSKPRLSRPWQAGQ
ncbi:zinc ribbon domain-containing protein [Lentibacillus saliphilus]|uniref:zinc ribbon domain-containing protein n=1 Tax=Lentibacillus saliphilus TaxID=2737028 RepID=UPI001C2F3795|nr:zinc ribbon domain-containing protein [Lentibacillus saliphilus]